MRTKISVRLALGTPCFWNSLLYFNFSRRAVNHFYSVSEISHAQWDCTAYLVTIEWSASEEPGRKPTQCRRTRSIQDQFLIAIVTSWSQSWDPVWNELCDYPYLPLSPVHDCDIRQRRAVPLQSPIHKYPMNYREWASQTVIVDFCSGPSICFSKLPCIITYLPVTETIRLLSLLGLWVLLRETFFPFLCLKLLWMIVFLHPKISKTLIYLYLNNTCQTSVRKSNFAYYSFRKIHQVFSQPSRTH